MNIIRKYAIDPLSFTHHPHKNLLQLADDIIHAMDNMGYKTQIDKVKSHTGVTHNDEEDTSTRNVVEGHKAPNIHFTYANPPVGGLPTWPQIRATSQGSTLRITRLANLRSSMRKLTRSHTSYSTTSPSTFYIKILGSGPHNPCILQCTITSQTRLIGCRMGRTPSHMPKETRPILHMQKC